MATKNEIMRVAVDLFAKSGYNSTSIRDIASKSNVNSSMVGYYFQSKENLYIEIFRNLKSAIDTLCDVATYETAPDALKTYIMSCISFCNEHRNQILVLLAEQMYLSNATITSILEEVMLANYKCFRHLYLLKAEAGNSPDGILKWKYESFFSHLKNLMISSSQQHHHPNLLYVQQSIKNVEVSMRLLFDIESSIVWNQA